MSIRCTANSTGVTSGGSLTIAGGVSIGKDTITNGIMYLNNTSDSVNNSTGALIVAGGIAVQKNISVQGNLNITGTFSSTGGFKQHPADFTVNISNTNNTVLVNVLSAKQFIQSNESTLYIAFQVIPVSSEVITSFEFKVPDRTNFGYKYDAICSINGFINSTNEMLGNMMITAVPSTDRCIAKFTAGSTGQHIVNVIVQYTNS
jgi:hypothetical protein